MRIRTDDLLYRVDRTWLGPKRFRFPWRATYTAYGIAVLVAAASGFLGSKLGVPINFVVVVIWITGTLLITKQITKALDPDRPISAALARLWQDLFRTPRPMPPKVEEAEQRLIVHRWRYGAQPERRWYVRLGVIIRDGIANGGQRAAAAMTRTGGLIGALGRLVARASAGVARGVARRARRRPRFGLITDAATDGTTMQAGDRMTPSDPPEPPFNPWISRPVSPKVEEAPHEISHEEHQDQSSSGDPAGPARPRRVEAPTHR